MPFIFHGMTSTYISISRSPGQKTTLFPAIVAKQKAVFNEGNIIFFLFKLNFLLQFFFLTVNKEKGKVREFYKISFFFFFASLFREKPVKSIFLGNYYFLSLFIFHIPNKTIKNYLT